MPTIDNLIRNAKNVVILNALPLNAFANPVRLDIIPLSNNDVPNVINALKGKNTRCFIGHAPTASLINTLGLSVNCTRAMWTFNNDTDLILAAVLKTRPAAPGAGDVGVTLGDLLFYLIIPTPLPTST